MAVHMNAIFRFSFATKSVTDRWQPEIQMRDFVRHTFNAYQMANGQMTVEHVARI